MISLCNANSWRNPAPTLVVRTNATIPIVRMHQ